MQKVVRTIGIVLETREDAERIGRPLEELYHWREPEEIESVTHALRSLGYMVVLLGTPADLCRDAKTLLAGVDFIFNISVGFVTRFRMAQGPAVYELLGVPYSGADPYSKMVSQNKQLTKSLLGQLGIPTPQWEFIQSRDDLSSITNLTYPLIVKPAWEGASIGVRANAVVRDKIELRERVETLFDSLGIPVIVERFISGKEMKVGMVGHRPIAFKGIIEDTDKDGQSLKDEFLYFDAKKKGNFGKRARDPKAVPYQKMLADCERIYQMFAPLDYATFDLRVDEMGNHYFLEFNADATLHPKRTLAECCRLNGMAYDELISGILSSAFQRFNLKRA